MNPNKNYKEECRCCFKELNKRSSHVEITEEIESKFYAVTQLKLNKSTKYPNKICVNCDETLQKFSEFKSLVVEKQLQLYERHPEEMEIKPDLHDIFIKEEKICESQLKENLADDPTSKPPASRQRRVCPDCGRHVMDLSRHWRRSHSKIINFICDFCGYGTLLKHRILKHMTNKHKPKELREKFQCQFCDFFSVDRSYLRVHEKTHTVAKGEHQCRCGKDFTNKHILAQHILLVHERKFKFKCEYCSKPYPNRNSLNEHITTKHVKKDIRDLICEFCSKSFITENQLKGHIVENHTEGPIKCEFAGCPKRFHKLSKRDRHMKSHTKIKDFHCDKCPASYSHATHLYRHQEAVHLGIRFPCEVPGCVTDFRRRDNYRVHLMKCHKNLESGFKETLLKRIKEGKL